MAKRVIGALMGFALFALPGSLDAQTPTPPASCGKEPIECPYGASGNWYTSINLKMLPNNAGQLVCMFDRENMEPSPPGPQLHLGVGGDGVFDVCNACDVGVTVQFDTWDAPWHEAFDRTNPPASADGTVSLDVPCQDGRSLSGYDANSVVQAHGWVRVKNMGALQFHDDFDPELEIDGGFMRFTRSYGPWVLSGVLAVLLLWAFTRRRMAN
jgi:hypothetical protein